MKKNIIRVLLILMIIADMAFIFSNSAQNSTASSSTSKNVTEIVAPVIVPNYNKMDEETKKETLISLDVIVREAAHLLQFVPLGFALYLLLTTVEIPQKLRFARVPFTLCFGLLYALSDEIHQIFVPGRSFQLFDICMDVSGVALGCIGGIMVITALHLIKKNR